jgi:hypothetical protein
MEHAFALVAVVAGPLAIAAWPVALLAVLGLGWVLRPHLRAHRAAFLAVLAVSLTAHLLDTALTLYITPDLALEANPLWTYVVEAAGLQIAIIYGFTGKVLTAFLHAECFVAYLALRSRMYPSESTNFQTFVARFGATADGGVSWVRIAAMAAFIFGTFSPFFFYICLLNAIGGVWEDFALYDALPSPLVATFVWGAALAGAFYVVSWRAFRGQGSPSR